MSDPGTTVRFTKAAWLLLPLLALPVGWWVGNLPTPEPAAPEVAVSNPTPVAEQSQLSYPPVSPSAPQVQVIESTEAGTTPARPAARQTAPAPVELSTWTTMDGALEESRRNGKPVFIDFSADWCGPCQALRREVFEDGTRAAALQGAVIPVSIVDQRRENGSNPPEIEALQQRYQVEAFPTLVVFSPATGRMKATRGFRGADATLAWITEAANSVR